MAGTPFDIAVGITVVMATSSFAAQIKDVNHSGITRESLETSHQGTTLPGATEHGSKTFTPADLTDPGDLTLEIHFNADTIPPIDLAPELVTINWPKFAGDITGPIWSGQAFFTNYVPGAVLNGLMTATVTLKKTGVQNTAVAT